MTTQRTLIVGIGSPHGDDQIGWLVADRLCDSQSAEFDIKKASTPSHLLDWLGDIERLIICDACQTHGRGNPSAEASSSGSRLSRWQWPTTLVSSLRSSGSHAFGLPQVLKLAERLGTLPDNVVVYGIQGERFDAFTALSPEVHVSLPGVVAEIVRDLSEEIRSPVLESASHA